MSETIDFFNGDRYRAAIFLDRYALNGEKTLVDISNRFKRVLDKDFHDGIDNYISTMKFIPGGRILRGLGSEHKLTLFNCLALPGPLDELTGDGSIYRTAERLARALKLGAGVGMDLSNLRPQGGTLGKSGGMASGPVSFAGLYSYTVSSISQGGNRRGAVLLSLKAGHPDIKKFIFCKNKDERDIRYANISVRFNEKPNNKILGWIAEAAWNTGEPGVIFDDKINEDFGPAMVGEKFESVNACSEIPLPAWGVCCLGAINLNELVDIDGNVDWDGIEKATEFGVKFLNKVLDYSAEHDLYPFEESKIVAMKTRQIGVGIMGLAHAFIKKGVPYGSPESIDFCRELILAIRNAAKKVQKNNTSLLSCQPTGTTSIVCGTTSGIEPLFALEYDRKDENKFIKIKDPIFKLLKDKRPANVFKCAHEIHWRERLAVQGELQAVVDNAISSTINLPYSTTKQTILEIFKTSYRIGLKSITVFREGCLREAIMTTDGCKSGSCDL